MEALVYRASAEREAEEQEGDRKKAVKEHHEDFLARARAEDGG